MDEKKEIKQTFANGTKVDVVEVLRLLIKDWKMLCVFAGVSGVIGLIFAFTTPKTYKSTVMLAPEESGQGFSGSISSLASMVGMNMKLGQTGDALYPEIYPDLVGSTDFILKLFPATVTTKKGDLTTDYYTYLTKHQKLALKDYPMALLAELTKKKDDNTRKGNGKASNLIFLTKEQDDVVKGIAHNINCSVDKKTNVITITVEDQDPLIAATIADTVKNRLQESITEYRTKKSKVDLAYMQKLFDEARQQYDKARQTYAVYADANQEVGLKTFQMKEEDLENDMQLKYNIYQQVVEQLQLAKAKVQERTPAFTVMQNATVPIKHAGTPKVVTLAIWLFLGIIVRCLVLGYRNLKKIIING